MAAKDVIFINSHPIQYFAPLYKYMNEQGLTTKAWYCSDASIKGGFDKQFQTEIKWDIPLLEGYDYHFFKNFSPKPSHSHGFFGLINLGMLKKLFQIPKSVIIVHGWHYFTLFCVLILGKLRGHTICVRCDIPLNQEKLKTGFKQKIKKTGLRYFLFPRIHYFLFIGTQNKLFYQNYQIPEKRLLFCPYAVDNNRFSNEYCLLRNNLHFLKKKHGIAENHKVIVFTAKYIEKKRPLDLLQAFKEIGNPNCWLFFVGEGELRQEMEAFIRENHLIKVVLTGFVNQSKISEYYAISDLFVMCSGEGENWGLSVNEAMNFNLPLVLSDLCGCAEDLIKNGKNGFVFKTGNIQELCQKMKSALLLNREIVGTTSNYFLQKFSYQSILENLQPLCYLDNHE